MTKETTGDKPTALSGQTLTLIDDMLYLFGRKKFPHKLNLLTLEWSLLTEVEYGYCHHSASLIGQKIYLFAGINYQTGLNTNDLFIYDTNQNELEK